MSTNKVNEDFIEVEITKNNRPISKFRMTHKDYETRVLFRRLESLVEGHDYDFRKIQLNMNDPIFNDTSVEKLKAIANDSLSKIQIVLKPCPCPINDKEERTRIIALYHDDPISGGHTGSSRTLAKIKNKYNWQYMRRDVASHVNNCERCLKNKPKKRTTELLRVTNTPQRPLTSIFVDTIGPLPKTINGNQYAITIMCALTKYLVSIPIENKNADTIARNIVKHFILT